MLTYAHHGTLKSATFPIFHGSTLVAPPGSVHFPIPFIALIPPTPLMTTAASSPVPQTLLEVPLAKGPGAAPMQRQLHHRFKEAILGGHLAPGSRLPGSRSLA